jgi:hypothetical protein
MSEGAGGRGEDSKGSGGANSPWQTRPSATSDVPKTEGVDPVERDDFSAFIFGLGHGDSGLQTPNPLNTPVGETHRSMLDDIFADMDPQIPYHHAELDFLNLFETPSNRANPSAISHNTINPAQSSLQNSASIPAPSDFHPFMIEPHPGIIIPTSTISSDAESQASTFLPPKRPRLHSHNLSSSAIDHVAVTPERFGSPNLVTRRISSPTVTHPQLRLETWPLASALELADSSLPSLSHESEASQPQSKPTTPTVRRRSLGTPSTESPTSATKPMKTTHNMIEKRYRLKLNDKILSLRNAVPALRTSTSPPEDLQTGRGAASKLNKGTVLTKATEYIQQLEHEKRQLQQEVSTLKEQLAAAAKRSEESDKQNFEMGGAADSMMRYETFSSDTGMISPESCTSLMSPEAEGNRMFEEVIAVEKLGLRPLRAKVLPGY